MTISLTTEKKQKIYDFASKLLNMTNITIRILARFIGKIVSSFPAVQHGRLFYRNLEFLKIKALKVNQGNYDSYVLLDFDSKFQIDSS